jgi:hypothetical protein
MQIPILSGIYTDESADFRTSYPRNLTPVPKSQGISAGYLRPADGIVSSGTGPGADRGGINWNSVMYRVMGTKLVSIDALGVATTLGEVGGTTQVSLDYSFDRLAIASNQNLFYWNGTALTQVTDVDLGVVIDMIWVDGYFMTTDGEFLVVTELADPTSVLPFKFGSSEVDPDPVRALKKVRNEVNAINRYTIEVFENIGGTGFPFQVIDGAQITRGSLGTHTCCVFEDTIAFLGSKRNESLSVWLGASGNSVKIATREIDQILKGYTEDVLETCLMEARIDESHKFLYLHLPDQTLVYDAAATRIAQQPVWFTLTSGLLDTGEYLAKNMVWVYDKWYVGDGTSIGYFDNSISTHWGNKISWGFGTAIIYNETNGALFHELELICLSGRVALGEDPLISTQYSLDGETWSQEKTTKAGRKGERSKRIFWLKQGNMKNWRIQRFRGDSDAFLTIARLDARIEGLAN